jgi:hypothetical protein
LSSKLTKFYTNNDELKNTLFPFTGDNGGIELPELLQAFADAVVECKMCFRIIEYFIVGREIFMSVSNDDEETILDIFRAAD